MRLHVEKENFNHKMAQYLRALAFPEDPGSVPNAHMVAYNQLSVTQFQEIWCHLRAPGTHTGAQTNMKTKHPYALKYK